MITTWLRKCLELLHVVPRSELVARIVSRHPRPDQITPGEMVIVRDNIDKWACFSCPGGCGETLKLSLNSQRRPRWSVTTDWLRRPTLLPSVRQTSGCKCHFWVRHGRIEWCRDSGHLR